MRGAGSTDPHAWWLPFLCAAIPVVAVHAAWALSTLHGHVDPCIPYLDGCASISRVARHGHGNTLFKLLMIPCAVLQGWHWACASRWSAWRDPDGRAASSLAWLGAIA